MFLKNAMAGKNEGLAPLIQVHFIQYILGTKHPNWWIDQVLDRVECP